jgi:hypothetical protein
MARPGDNFASFNGTTAVKPSLIDHIFLQDTTLLTLNSVGGSMHPTLALITDQNPTWVGIQWPDNPPSPTLMEPSKRIINAPDLPADEEVRDIFAQSLDSKLEFIMAGSWPLESISPERAGASQGSIAQASVQLTQELSPPKPRRQTGRGHRFKNGYSPEFMLIRISTGFFGDIHIDRVDSELALIMDRWFRVFDAHPGAKDHPHLKFFPSNITLAK